MLVILVVIGTKYECNLDHVGDRLCLEFYIAILLIFLGPNVILTCFLTEKLLFPYFYRTSKSF